MKIQDGWGTGQEARVDGEGRLLVEAVTETEQLEAAVKGESFQVGSGAVTLTSANESALLYFKNNEDRDVIVTAVNITSTKQTGSSAGVFLAKLYTEGTGLSAGSSQTALNSNFGSSKTLTADITAGQEAATITNGTASGAFYISEGIFFNTETAWVLPKGTTVAVSITPGASNTSVTVTCTLEVHIARTVL